MAKVRIEFVRLVRRGHEQELDTDVVTQALASQTLDVTAAVLSQAAPDFGVEFGQAVDGHARITVLSGAVVFAWGKAPNVATQPTLRVEAGDPVHVPVSKGWKLSLLEAEAAALTVTNPATGATTDAAVVNPVAAGSVIGVLKGVLATLLPVKDATGAQADAEAVSGNGSLVGILKGIRALLGGNGVTVVNVLMDQATAAPSPVAANAITGAIDVGSGGRATRIAMPAAFTGDTLTLRTSTDGVTFNDLYDDFGFEVTIKVGASRSVLLDPAKFADVKKFQLRSGTSVAPVAQAAARTLGIVKA